MPRRTIDFDSVRKIGLTLPDVEESTAYGSPALKVRGKLMACVPTHRSAEPGSLAVRVGFDDRAELLAAAPDVYYMTDHYLNYNAVLVRLSRVAPGVLRDLLGMERQSRCRRFSNADNVEGGYYPSDCAARFGMHSKNPLREYAGVDRTVDETLASVRKEKRQERKIRRCSK